MSQDYGMTAEAVLKAVGGKGNVKSLVHCATRLRFQLFDESLADDDTVRGTAGVISVVKAGGLYQVIIGNDVNFVFEELGKLGVNMGEPMVDDGDRGGEKKKEKLFSRILQTVPGVFGPVFGIMVAAGMLKGLYAILTACHVPDAGTAMVILNACGDALFYFFPMVIGYTSAKKFGMEPMVGLLVGAVLVHPTIVAYAPNAAESSYSLLPIFGLKWGEGQGPLVMMSYTSSVLPIIFGTYFLSFLYKRLVKKMPTAFRNFVAPAITILVGVFGILLIVGPAFTFLGMGIAKIIEMIRGIPYIGGGLLGMIIGALWQVFVVFGAHWALVPIMFMEMSSNMVDGQTWLLSYVAAATQLAVLAQVAAVVAMALRMKNKERKAAALSTSISGLFGITEPIIYGFTLPKKQPFLYGCIGGAVGGLIVGALKVVPIFGPQGVLVISSTVYKGVGDVQFWGYLIGLLAAVSITFLLTFSLYKPDEAENREIEAVEKVDISGIDTEKASKIYAPAPGLILPLKQSADEVHQEETLGKGIIILPTGGKIYAPFDGTVDMIADTHHAVGLKSKDGVELLIHVGIDTVKLNKEGFTIAVTEGQEVRKGDLLLRYDKDIIARKGFSLETQVIVTNTPNYKQVTIGHLGKTEGRHLVLYAEAFA